MNKPRIVSPLRPITLQVAALLLFIVGSSLTFTALANVPDPNGGGPGQGPWMNSNYEPNCSDLHPGTVCAEWPNAANNTVTICCIPAADVNTFRGIGQSCYEGLTTRALD